MFFKYNFLNVEFIDKLADSNIVFYANTTGLDLACGSQSAILLWGKKAGIDPCFTYCIFLQ